MKKKFYLKNLLKDDYYNDEKERLKKIVIDDFERRKEEVVLVDLDCNEYELTLGNLITMLILFKPFKEEYGLQDRFCEKFIVEVSDLKEIEEYFNIIFEEFGPIGKLEQICLDVLSELAAYSAEILGVFGATINLYDIAKLAIKNENFKKDIIDFNFESQNENLDFEEMDDLINQKQKEMYEYILNDEDNCLKYLIESNSGISPRQLREVLLAIGPKPDGRGNIVEYPVDTSYIKGQNYLNFFIDAINGRTAQILNWNNTKESGYFTRKLTLLCEDNHIGNLLKLFSKSPIRYKDSDGEGYISDFKEKLFIDGKHMMRVEIAYVDGETCRKIEKVIPDYTEDCGTKQTCEVDIKDDKTLNRLNNRNYVDENGEIKKICSSTDKHLIGKKIKLRSPIKCACKNSICKTCYGDLWKVNKDKNIGVVAVLLLTAVLIQLSLSAKHNLQASPTKIEWGEEFKKYFSIDRNQIFINNVDDVEPFTIIIDDYIENEEISDDVYQFEKFKIKDSEGNIDIIEAPLLLTLDNDSIDMETCLDSKEECFIIKSKQINENDSIFTYTVENNELTATLEHITNLIERNSFIKNHTIDEVLNEFIDAINNSPIYIQYVHLEIILKELCKIHNNDRTLFRKSEDSPIEEIYRVTEALVKNPAPGKSLSYQEFYKQITQNHETFEKNQYSVIDELLR